MLIFNRIKEIREKLGFVRQDDFSKALGIAFRTYQTYEQGQVKVIPHTLIEKLNKQYNVSLTWLITGEGTMFNEEQSSSNKSNNISIEEVLIDDIKKLLPKQQEYYYHRVKADLLENEKSNIN